MNYDSDPDDTVDDHDDNNDVIYDHNYDRYVAYLWYISNDLF